MFSDKKSKEFENPGSGQNRINDGTILKGDVVSNGYFRIDGVIEGNVKTPSKVVIGKTGKIVGTLTCNNADIEGQVKGNIDIDGTLSLRSTSKIEGKVITGKLAVEQGAFFNATCKMKEGNNKLKINLIPGNKNEEKITQNNSFERSQRTPSKEIETKTD
ncbi:MAG: polymer-forming cytoskeletal protein [Flavobacteriales bacterium]|nr:MAG: polymer-forming cytoskeletal protein [Flavobacteriales bacterium]